MKEPSDDYAAYNLDTKYIKKTFFSPTLNGMVILQKNNFQHTKETLYDTTNENEQRKTVNSSSHKRWASYINFQSDHYHTICFNLLLWNV